MVRATTLLRLTARLIVVVSFLSAATFQAAWAQTAPNLLTAGSFAVLGASTVTNSGAAFITGAGARVVMVGGATATNVWWAVGSSATLGANTEFSGNILALASITLNTGANVFGRTLALNGAVTMLANKVSAVCASAPCLPPSP